MEVTHITDAQERMRAEWAMNASLGLGILLLLLKGGAYWITQSSAIFSDAAESVIHVAAVAFAVFSLRLSYRPPNKRFPFGYEKISFFSAGVEGGLISLAAVTIFWVAGERLLTQAPVENLEDGMLLILFCSLLTGGMGWYLIRLGKKQRSLVLEANGRHVMTDSITSLGVVAGLVLVRITGIHWLDPLVAFAVAAQILVSGFKMVRAALGGLMDRVDPEFDVEIRSVVRRVAAEEKVEFHGLRFRSMGRGAQLVLHLLLPYAMPLGQAHQIATTVERRIAEALPYPVQIYTHLESKEDHELIHGKEATHFPLPD